MPLVIKGNKQLTVDEYKVKEFLQLGYSEIDEKGKIIQKAVPTNLSEFKEAYKTVCVENDSLKKEIDKLKKENAKLKKADE